MEPHLLVKVHSASAPWLNHCTSQCNIRLAVEIDIVMFEWQQEGVRKQRQQLPKLGLGKQRLSNSYLKTRAGKGAALKLELGKSQAQRLSSSYLKTAAGKAEVE